MLKAAIYSAILFIMLSTPPPGLCELRYKKTPADQEGPFYPITKRVDEDNDLTWVNGQNERAKGKILKLHGIVINTEGTPLDGVTIQIWQTDPQGLYLHPYDSSKGNRDPNFQYWGKTVTTNSGRYLFMTILPGAYEPRPAHIHFKVFSKDKEVLTSQIYFRNHPDYSKYITIPERYRLQMADVLQTGDEEFESFFKIVID